MIVRASSAPLTFSGRSPRADSGSSEADSAGESQRPSFEMLMGTTSYLVRSNDSITERAERTEPSCSREPPPKITPTRILLVIDESECYEDEITSVAKRRPEVSPFTPSHFGLR